MTHLTVGRQDGLLFTTHVDHTHTPEVEEEVEKEGEERTKPGNKRDRAEKR